MFLYTIVSLLPIVIIILAFIFVITIFRRMERRAEERLKLDKENINLQQQQLREINNRLTTIENILKEVD